MNYPLLENKLPQSIKRVWKKTNLLVLIIMLSLGLIMIILLNSFDSLEDGWAVIVIGYSVLTIAIFVITRALIPFRYNYFRYEITNDDIIYQKGFFFRSITYVPITRIQHVETEQGPFLRKDGLMELLIHTAATTHRIAGLSVEDTLTLRTQIIEKVKEAKEDV